MGGDGHGIDAQLGGVERNVQIPLDGIGMKRGAGSMCGRGKLADRLYHAGLVVGNHDAHERHVVA